MEETSSLYSESLRRQRLSDVVAEMNLALLGPGSPNVLGVIATQLAQLFPSDLVLLVTPTDNTHLRIDAIEGGGAESLTHASFPAAGSLVARVFQEGKLLTGAFVDEQTEKQLLGIGTHFGLSAVAPLRRDDHIIGTLCLLRAPHSGEFSSGELATIAEFARQASRSLSRSWARRDRLRLEMIEEHNRIARDLHDHVIQRLFATGLGLQALASADHEFSAELETHVSELDSAIADIRSAIYSLRARAESHTNALIRHRLLDVVAEATPTLSSAPRITFVGPVNLMLTDALADDVVAVVREALANVARHAHAERTNITVSVTERDLTVLVEDDGIGLTPLADKVGGTTNLAQRAAAYGGTFTLTRITEGGTRARWHVPVAPD